MHSQINLGLILSLRGVEYEGGTCVFHSAMVFIHSVCFFSSIRGSKRSRILFTSPIRAVAEGMFLLISAGSISICKTLLFCANFEASEITRSEKRAPSASTTSLSVTAILLAFVPCIPNIPKHKGELEGNAARAIRLSVTGISAFFAKASNCSLALLKQIPPPA